MAAARGFAELQRGARRGVFARKFQKTDRFLPQRGGGARGAGAGRERDLPKPHLRDRLQGGARAEGAKFDPRRAGIFRGRNLCAGRHNAAQFCLRPTRGSRQDRRYELSDGGAGRERFHKKI